MNNMTGGSLPARPGTRSWPIAHQGIELKNPYGVAGPAPSVASTQAPAHDALAFRAADDLVAPLARRADDNRRYVRRGRAQQGAAARNIGGKCSVRAAAVE